MKKITLFLLVIFGRFSFASAQGWGWGIEPQFSSTSPYFGGYFSGPLAVDASGNVFTAAGSFNLNYSVFGPDTVRQTHSWYTETIVAKASAFGSFLWALGTDGNVTALPVGIAANSSGCLYLLGSFSGIVFALLARTPLNVRMGLEKVSFSSLSLAHPAVCYGLIIA